MNAISQSHPVPRTARHAALFDWAQRRPVTTAVLILAADLILLTLIRLGLQVFAPTLPTDFVALFPSTALLVAGIAALNVWRAIGVNRPSQWQHLGLLLLPLIVLVGPPLVGGLKPIDAGRFAFLLVGYVLTGIREELLHRGIILRVLRRLGEGRATLISAVLFGLLHLSNIMVRDNPAIVAAQAVGAFCFGVGFGALRLRTNTVVPLIVLHAVHDLLLQMTNLPLIALDVTQVTVLLFYGVFLLWRSTKQAAQPAALAAET